jgi:hypothetical protein
MAEPLPESLPQFTKERGKEEDGKKTLYRNVCLESVIGYKCKTDRNFKTACSRRSKI